MAWIIPKYSKSKVDQAGSLLAKMPQKPWLEDWEKLNALDVIENYRASHSFPLLIFRLRLAKKAKIVDAGVIVAQRIKRLASVEAKLSRFPTMRLSHMQDIGGCRAIFNSVRSVRKVATAYETGRLKHKLLRIDDYISNPRDTGYRGIHLVYSYNSDKNELYNGLKIEIQLRSQLQHAWATAVETVDIFTGQALKASQGVEVWQRFFSLMGSYIAIREKTPCVPCCPADKGELWKELNDHAAKLDVIAHLLAYRNTLQSVDYGMKGASYYLLRLNVKDYRMSVTGYKQKELEQANSDYTQAEAEALGSFDTDAVLVSVDSLSMLKRAFPNYFADTHVFIKTLTEAITGEYL